MCNQQLPYTIRPMESSDIPAVVDIDRLSFPTPWSPSSYAYEIKHNRTSFYYVLLRANVNDTTAKPQEWYQQLLLNTTGLLTRKKSNLIGYVGFRLRGKRAHISTIAVHPDWRRKGLGELLLLTGIEEALDRGLPRITLEVRASNHIAQRLYHKYGFRFTGIHKGYYRDGEDACLMEAQIANSMYGAHLASLRQTLEKKLTRTGGTHRPGASVGQNKTDTL